MITDLFRSPAQRRQAEQFADLLEGRLAASGHELESLVTLAASMRAPEIAPSGDFSAALRARLVQQASERASAPRVPLQRTATAQESRPHRIRQVVAAMTAVAIVGGAGAAAASTRALPGDTLYGLKRGLESAQLSLAGSDLARGRELLEQADARLGEAEKLVASGGAADADTRRRIGQALADMNAAVLDGSSLLTDVYRQTGDAAALELLDGFVVEQRQRLAALMDLLAAIDPALRDEAGATADLLASLHAQVVAITRPAQALTGAAGAARDPSASGGQDGRTSDNLVQTQPLPGGTGSSPSSAGGQGSGGLSQDLVDGVTEAGTGATSVVGTPGTGNLGGTGPTAAPAPTVLPAPPVTTPSTLPVPVPQVQVPVPVPQVQVPTPCVPVPPLTTC